ncbi:unnamed protein product [Spirodela intermedia]|uniref:Uncharacterized protein n=1 Tax=Spirodela intermedia TaxID=51605 RepID=A0A7I8J2L3_SPIIN|nr:unnamed protein product [Spirodela intermedia]CAA6664299.1 unnamed protein product [Spirodela intermedia]
MTTIHRRWSPKSRHLRENLQLLRGVMGTGPEEISKKDRHSKIFTAQGPRDRRMRLSLDVARRFFDLQDMLGFDKASNTVDWLMAKSGTAIGGSSLHRVTPRVSPPLPSARLTRWLNVKTTPPRPSGVTADPARKALPHPSQARESRVMARARARERTREKKMMEVVSEVGRPSSLTSADLGISQSSTTLTMITTTRKPVALQ